MEENELKPWRELSKFEKESLQKALKKQKENIVKPQIVQGKEFKGDSFISEPKILEFLDFEVGIKNILQFSWTNISWTINSYKVLEIEDRYADYFEIIYTPPGPLSAGLNSKAIINFFPEIREDIDTFLPLLTQTGPVNIPIRCRYKRTEVICINNTIDFEKVIYGEEKTINVILKNNGGLPSNIFIKNKSGITLYDKTENMSMYSKKSIYDEYVEDDDFKLLKELKLTKSYRIEGYSSLTIPITYQPKEIKDWNTKIILYFENVIDVPQFFINLKGSCIELPIEIKNSLIDYKICLLDHIYREKIIFFNKSKKPMKIQISMPYEATDHFIMNPNFGYIQSESEFHMWLKVKIDKNMMKMCKSFFYKENKLKIPMKLIPSEQKLPVEFNVMLEISTDILEIEPNIIDFDKIFENTGKEIELTLKNKSKLPQEIYFCKKPQNITIEPDKVPIIIKPLEDYKIKVIYKGYQIKNDKGFLNYKKITGNIGVKEEKIFYKCKVLKSPLKIKTLRIDFPCLELNEKSNHNIEIKNISNECYLCEIVQPDFDICGLKIVPKVFKIDNNNSKKINIEYISSFKKYTYKLKKEIDLKSTNNSNIENKNIIDDNQSNLLIKDNKNNKKAWNKKELEEQRIKEEEFKEQLRIKKEKELENEKALENSFNHDKELQLINGKLVENTIEEEKSQHYKWLIPVYFKDINLIEGNKNVIFIEVNTTTINKKIVANKYEIDFGEIAVGFRKLENLQIKNNSENKFQLFMNILPFYSGFNVINALREIKSGETKNLVVEFQPITQKSFKEELVIYSKEAQLTVTLKGKSLLPEVEIDIKNGVLDMGSLLVGDQSEKTFKIKNITNFNLNYEIKSIKSGISNKNNLNPFIFKNYKGIIKENEEIPIDIIFRPDRVSENYFNYVKIKIPKQKNPKYLFIYGKCFDKQSYISNFIDIEKNFLDINYENKIFDFMNLNNYEIYSELNNNIIIKFNDSDDNPIYNKKLIIGSCKLNNSKLEKPTTYEINLKDDHSKFFKIDPVKGTVNGNYVIINIDYEPPEKDDFIKDIEILNGIGKWFETNGNIKISGGYNSNSNSSDNVNYDIVLKAFMNHI